MILIRQAGMAEPPRKKLKGSSILDFFPNQTSEPPFTGGPLGAGSENEGSLTD